MSVTVGGVYHSYIIGRVRFIATDNRSYRTPNDAVDNSSKSMLGATQKTWFKNEITNAKTANQAIIWLNSVPWIAPPGDNNGDNWGGYQTEKAELVAYFTSANVLTQMIIVCGDMHAAAMDDGTHANGIPVMLAFPENQTTQVYGGVYTQGPITHTGTRLMGYGGIIQVTDNGGSLINISLRVINEVGTLMTQNANLRLIAPGKIFITHVIDVINFSAFPESNQGPNA